MRIICSSEEENKVALIDILPGNCFKCSEGSLIYMHAVHVREFPPLKSTKIHTTYAVDLRSGNIYPFHHSDEYQVIPIDITATVEL